MSVKNSSFLLPVKTDGSVDLSRVCSEVKNMEEGGPYTCLGCGHSCGRGISALYDLTKSHTRSQHKVHQIVKANVGKDGTFSHFWGVQRPDMYYNTGKGRFLGSFFRELSHSFPELAANSSLFGTLTCPQSSPGRSSSRRSARPPQRSAAAGGCSSPRRCSGRPAGCWQAGSAPPSPGSPSQQVLHEPPPWVNPSFTSSPSC